MSTLITLYYQDLGELSALKNLGGEFARNGFEVKYTSDIFSASDIGIYACGASAFFNFAKGDWVQPNSDFSVFLIHDLYQHNGLESDFFVTDPLHIFDVALFPSEQWIFWLKLAAKAGNVHPKINSFVTGYPKSDSYFQRRDNRRDSSIDIGRFGSPIRVLIAASWENRHIVKNILDLSEDPNFKVFWKSPEWSIDFESTVSGPWKEVLLAQHRESKYVNELLKKYPRIERLPTNQDIFEAIELCDVVLSNGSNVLFESLLCGKVSVNIADWLQPVGAKGEFMRKSHVDASGILSGSSKTLVETIRLAITMQFSKLAEKGSFNLVDPQTLGKSSWLSVKTILNEYENQKIHPKLSRRENSTYAADDVDRSEVEIMQIELRSLTKNNTTPSSRFHSRILSIKLKRLVAFLIGKFRKLINDKIIP